MGVDSESAATSFSRNHVVLSHLSEQINNRKLLYSLCLVSREFNAAFSRKLYKCIRVDRRNADFFRLSRKRQYVIDSGNLMYTKVLIMTGQMYEALRENLIADGEEDSFDIQILAFSYANNAALDLIESCPNLTSFACMSFELDHPCMAALAKLPQLKSLSIDFLNSRVPKLPADLKENAHWGPYHERHFGNSDAPEPELSPAIHLLKLRNLRRLSLLWLAGDAYVWRMIILHIFLNNTRLRHFSLSRDGDADLDEVSPAADAWSSLLEWVCKHHHEATGRPLSLQTVRLDPPFRFPNPTTFCNAINLERLESLTLNVYERGSDGLKRALEVVSPSFTPNLKYLCCDNFRSHIIDILPEGNVNLGLHVDWTGNNILPNSGNGGSYSLFDPRSKIKSPRLSVALHGGDLKSIDTSRIQMCHWITHLMISVFRLGSDRFDYRHDAPSPYFADSLAAKFPNLEALWIYDENSSHVQRINYATGDSELSFDDSMQRTAEQIVGAFTHLHYLRITEHDYRAYHGTGTVKLERLDEWEAEIEAPAFFHLPNPSRWCSKAQHFDL